jgi:hypothetical protein
VMMRLLSKTIEQKLINALFRATFQHINFAGDKPRPLND